MQFGHVIGEMRHRIGVVCHLGRRAAHRRSEFDRVNAVLGSNPVRPDLSGLALRRPGIPRRVTRLLISLAYRWAPSGDYTRRQDEMRRMNASLKRRPPPDVPPPTLTYGEGLSFSPLHIRPLITYGRKKPPELPQDLSELEALEMERRARVLHPQPHLPHPEYLLARRPLVRRRYGRALRHSRSLHVAASLCVAILLSTVGLWLSQWHRAEVAAADQMHHARQTFEAQLNTARAYGLDRRDLRRLAREEQALRAVSRPFTFPGSRAGLAYYHAEAARYAALTRTIHTLERHALELWTSRERKAHAAFLRAVQDARAHGLPTSHPAPAACATPACLQRVVTRERNRARWLHETSGTIAIYAAAITSTPDPASAAASILQEDQNLAAVVNATVPVPLTRLDAMLAGSASAPAGALAHLDRDVLEAALVHALPHRAIVVSLERGTLTAYRLGHAVLTATIAAGSATPDGVFHIQTKVRSVPVLYWSASRGRPQSSPGILPDWMSFSGSMALQGAPWLGSNTAPSTPGSIDLPVAAARALYSFASIGTEVVIE